MPRPSGPVVIDAQVGSNVKRWVGFGLTLGGIVSAVTGTLTYMNAPAESAFYRQRGSRCAHVAGIVYIVIGVVLMAVGIPLSTSSTSVQIR